MTDDPRWCEWSRRQLDVWAGRGDISINAVVYAELSVGFARIEDLDAVLAQHGVRSLAIPRAALFLAGKTYQAYRRAGGVRTGVLADFFVGAHASVAGLPLLTRDARGY